MRGKVECPTASQRVAGAETRQRKCLKVIPERAAVKARVCELLRVDGNSRYRISLRLSEGRVVFA